VAKLIDKLWAWISKTWINPPVTSKVTRRIRSDRYVWW